MTHKVIIMVGVSGSGKSTRAKKIYDEAIAAGLSAIVISADLFLYENGVYNWTAERAIQAHKQAQLQYKRHLSLRTHVIIIDNTNVRARYRKPYIDAAKEAGGYDIYLEVVQADPNLVNEYVKRNVHGVSKDLIEAQLRRIGSVVSGKIN